MIRILASNGDVLWEAFPKQEEALLREEDEICFGGARGGTKTACGIAWLLMGNLNEPTNTIADGGYYLHPQYRALVLRKNISDMGDWIAKAKRMYAPLGGEFRERPPEFRFPSGATIVIGHLDDEDAFEKYQGQEFVRILIEELTQIKSVDLYLKVRASCRCPHEEMRPQIFLTTNPGGPGHGWVRERFIAVAAPGVPYKDPATGGTRVFIPARVKDNPIYANDPQYMGILMSLPPALRRAWLDGDWDAQSGVYFDEFRVAPLTGEPPEARHVISQAEAALLPWYNRWLSCDWGYSHDAAVHKYCQEPNGRIHVYDEMVMNRTTPEELGIEMGRFIAPEIHGGAQQKNFQLFLSPDAFARRTDERTVADQIAYGIEKVLGPDSCYILPVLDQDASAVFSRAQNQRSSSIMIQRAANQRVAGWMYMKSLMRWWPLLGAGSKSNVEPVSFDPILAAKLYDENKDKWRQYCTLFKREEEVLPKLVFHRETCPKAIRAIPLATANDPDRGDPEDVDKRHVPGVSDVVDDLRYGIFAAKSLQLVEPFESFLAKHMKTYTPATGVLDGQSKIMMVRRAEEKYAELNAVATKPIKFNNSRVRAQRRGGGDLNRLHRT